MHHNQSPLPPPDLISDKKMGCTLILPYILYIYIYSSYNTITTVPGTELARGNMLGQSAKRLMLNNMPLSAHILYSYVLPAVK